MYTNELHTERHTTPSHVVAMLTTGVAFLLFYSYAFLSRPIQPLLLANPFSRCLRFLLLFITASLVYSALTRLTFNPICLLFLLLRYHLSLFPIVRIPLVPIFPLCDHKAGSNL